MIYGYQPAFLTNDSKVERLTFHSNSGSSSNSSTNKNNGSSYSKQHLVEQIKEM